MNRRLTRKQIFTYDRMKVAKHMFLRNSRTLDDRTHGITMSAEHEHTLNVWTAELLRDLHGLDAKQEQKQADRKRIDIEIRSAPLRLPLKPSRDRQLPRSARLLATQTSD